jgi:HAD superfamily hydrolase (TIGR01509 family)
MLRTVIIDFDLTLVDSIDAITRGLNQMADHFGLRRVDANDTRRVMSLAVREFWSTLWGDYDDAWEEFFLREVDRNESQYLVIYPGVVEFLEKAKAAGLSLGLATNRGNAWSALTAVGLAAYFDAAVGSGDVARGKPAPNMLLMALNRLGADAASTIYVGDAVFDMEAAARAGIRGVGLTEGGTSREDLSKAGAWQVRDKFRDLDEFIRQT